MTDQRIPKERMKLYECDLGEYIICIIAPTLDSARNMVERSEYRDECGDDTWIEFRSRTSLVKKNLPAEDVLSELGYGIVYPFDGLRAGIYSSVREIEYTCERCGYYGEDSSWCLEDGKVVCCYGCHDISPQND